MADHPIADGQAALDALYADLFGPPGGDAPAAPPAGGPSAPAPDDATLLARAFRARNGARFAQLWAGDTSGNGGDDSAADLALCNILAHWCGPDPARIDRLFRRSGLYREKWDRPDYAFGLTIAKALTGRVDYHDWAGEGRAIHLNGHHPASDAPPDEADTGDRPILDAADQDLPRIAEAAWGALTRLNDADPRLFRYGGLLARVERDERDRPRTLALTADRLRHELARAADWRRTVKGAALPALPPLAVVNDLLARPEPPLPVLEAIVGVPTYAADGSLDTAPGYSARARRYYAPPAGFRAPPVPARPTAAQVAAARDLLLGDLIGDFPFVGDGERAHALALLLQPFARALIDGPTPLHLIEKPQVGTGATLLAEMLLFPATGEPLAAMTEGRDEDEWRKRLTARLRPGPAAILIDNIRDRLDTAQLASALTAREWEDRLLGTSDTIRLPVRCAWIATGNNPALSGEIARRTIRIRLDSRVDRPWLRTDFRHPDLRGWAAEHRPALVGAALTLVAAWLAAGRPRDPAAPRLGMFEHWSRVIGGILDVAGVPGFLANLDELYDNADTETAAIHALVGAWWDKHATAAVSAADLWPLVGSAGIDLDLGNGNERALRTHFGQFLARLRDRRYTIEAGPVRVAHAGNRNRAQRWKLDRARPGDDV